MNKKNKIKLLFFVGTLCLGQQASAMNPLFNNEDGWDDNWANQINPFSQEDFLFPEAQPQPPLNQSIRSQSFFQPSRPPARHFFTHPTPRPAQNRTSPEAETLRQLQDFFKKSVEQKTLDSILIDAAVKGNCDVIELVLNSGANVHTKNKNDIRALHFALWNGHEKAALLLLKRGADPEARMLKTQKRPIHLAARKGLVIFLKTLIYNKKVDYSARTINNETFLYFLIPCQNSDPFVQNIIASIVRVKRTDLLCVERKATEKQDSATLLHIAAGCGKASIIKMLLKAGCEKLLNAQTKKKGKTPLHLACQQEHYSTAATLLKAGADSSITDSAEKTPRDYAREKNNGALMNLLLFFSLQPDEDIRNKDKESANPKAKYFCGICHDDEEDYTRKALCILNPCGHIVHKTCYQLYKQQCIKSKIPFVKCPNCNHNVEKLTYK